MPFVQEPIQITAAPPELGREFGIELARDPAKMADRDLLDTTAFDQGDQPPGHAGACGEVVLSPAKSVSQGSISPAELNVVHGGMVSPPAYRRIIRKPGSPYPPIVTLG